MPAACRFALFVALGVAGVTDGRGTAWNHWVAVESGTHETLFDVAFANGHWVAVGRNGTIVTSTDGQLWQPSLRSATRADLFRVAGSVDQWMAAGGRALVKSGDLVGWEAQSLGENVTLGGVASGGGGWLAYGTQGDALAVFFSRNGVDWSAPWTSGTLAFSPSTFLGIGRGAWSLTAAAYGGGRWVVMANNPNQSSNLTYLFHSTDGIQWAPFGIRFSDLDFLTFNGSSLAYGDDGWRLTGNAAGFFPTHPAMFFRSADGANWTDEPTKTIAGPVYGAWIAWGGGRWITEVLTPTPQWYSLTPTPSGSSAWTPMAFNTNGAPNLTKVAYGKGRWVGISGSAILCSDSLPFLTAAPSGNRQPFRATVTGVAGEKHRIQVSSNLVDWAELPGAAAVPSDMTFEDALDATANRRFYRAVVR